jgi:isopentenyl-diphosphate delta-isomerase
MMEEQVILVDYADKQKGILGKAEAHSIGALHRAFSVFIFNSEGYLLLQKRAAIKYHSALLWTNTCCGHPRPGQKTAAAATRRLKEEMGITTDLNYNFSIIYFAEFENGLAEHELDHVFTGFYNSSPAANPKEAADWVYMPVTKIRQLVEQSPEQFTHWFKLIFKKIRPDINISTNAN